MKDMPIEGFDRYISLGDNCEAGLQFWRIGYDESSIFRFTIIDSDKLINIIENNFADIFCKENLVPASVDHMIRDTKTGIAFHSELYSAIDPGSGKRSFRNDYDFDEVFTKEKTKIEYFVQKWRELVSSKERILYFIKKNHDSNREDAETILNTFLKYYPEHDFLILYIQPRSLYEPDWRYERLHNVYVDHLAPYDNTEAGADISGWNDIFRRYPLKNKLEKEKQEYQKKVILPSFLKKLRRKLRKLS